MSFYSWFAERQISGFGAKRRRRTEKLKMDMILKHLKAEKVSMLEIGPGIGWFAAEADKEGFSYEAIEPAEPLRKILVDQGLDVIDGMTPPIPKDECNYDLVYSDQVLEHFPTYTKALGFAQECHRVLKKDGLLCLIAPNYLTQREFFFEIDYTHNYVTTERRMIQLVNDAGFEVIQTAKNIGPAVGPLRWLQLFLCWLLALRPVGALFNMIKMGGLLHSLKKNLFETIILIARKREK